MARRRRLDPISFLIRISIAFIVIAVILIYPIVIVYNIIKGYLEHEPLVGWLIIIGLFVLLILLPITIIILRRQKRQRIIEKYDIDKYNIDDFDNKGSNKKRVPIPAYMKIELLRRAHGRCENPNCSVDKNLQFHHINFKNWDTQTANLAVLCPNCHSSAHRKDYSTLQVQNWISMNSINDDK